MRKHKDMWGNGPNIAGTSTSANFMGDFHGTTESGFDMMTTSTTTGGETTITGGVSGGSFGHG